MHSRAWLISPLSWYGLGNLCVRQATQGCLVNKESFHSFRGGRNLPAKVNFQVPHTPKQNQISQLARGPLALPWPWHEYAGNWFCCASSLSGFYLTWAPVGSWPALRSHATWVTLLRCPKECHHLVAKHLATGSLSHLMVAPRLGLRELAFYITNTWGDFELFGKNKVKTNRPTTASSIPIS